MEFKGEEERKPFLFGFFRLSSHMFYQYLILMNYLDGGGEDD